MPTGRASGNTPSGETAIFAPRCTDNESPTFCSLTIGDSFSEGGFLPYAVVIHLTYIDVYNKLRIRHFVSDSNQDSTDIGGKFSEALDKLIKWVNENNLSTQAIQEFKDLYRKGHFPGLGSVKKLSIMHHIELLLNIIK